MEGDGEFLEQQPDHGDISMSDDDDGVVYRQVDEDDLYRALVMMAVRSYTHDSADMFSEHYYYAFGLAGGGASRARARAFPGHPFPVQVPAPTPATVASEAAIAALEAAETPADDCCPDGAAPAAWSRVAPCGHRFHAGCVEKWLRVKPSCPVCRRPAAAAAVAAPAAVPGVLN
ncbi:hypothetical protein C2845_PM09G02520 [Panicum miliaceum]|uniref:RING-type domain-containing protein n=1 Tax=Panicum miliaceum TaxID=4540 RepID=A0A3L6S4B1_PANMI|nr:hypothetical protein C2845_PM09G02520 [Panicum miliaceum]